MTPCADRWVALALVAQLGACGGGEPSEADPREGGDGPGVEFGTELRLDVTSDAPTYVHLAGARVVSLAGDAAAAEIGWDLAFQGWDIFTNGGVSGPGMGAAFGPLSFSYFVTGKDPSDVPFLIEDATGGAFRDWYAYDGEFHALYSRFHVYGVKREERLFKLQILGYYGEVQGAPISARYRLRYAEVTPEGAGPVVDVTNLDAAAGGLAVGIDAPSACLTLGVESPSQLSPEQALESSAWDVCFRRDAISVNGELGGPGGVGAVDLDATRTASETLDDVKARSADGEEAAFEAIDHAALVAPGLAYRGDRTVSAFSDAWVDASVEPPALARDATWLVVAADGESRYLLQFNRLESPTTRAAGTVVLRVRPVFSP